MTRVFTVVALYRITTAVPLEMAFLLTGVTGYLCLAQNVNSSLLLVTSLNVFFQRVDFHPFLARLYKILADICSGRLRLQSLKVSMRVIWVGSVETLGVKKGPQLWNHLAHLRYLVHTVLEFRLQS